MDIVVHIGTEKTGTTSIQRWLNRNRDNLVACGLYYLRTPGNTNHRDFPAYCLRQDRFDDHCRRKFIDTVEKKLAFQEEFRARLLEEIDALPGHVRTVIASSEHFHSRLLYEDEIENLRALLAQRFRSVRIVVYLRNQIDMAISLCSTVLKGGDSAELDSYIVEKCTAENDYYNYHNFLEKWKKVFGRENISVRLYDRKELANNNIIDDFLCQIDPALTEKLDTSFEYQNVSINHFGQCLLNSINKNIPRFIDGVGYNPLSTDLGLIVAEGAKGTGLLPDPETYRSIQARFAESNERVRKEYFPEREYLFTEKLPSSNNLILSKENEAVLDEVIGVLARSHVPDFYADILLDLAADLAPKDIESAYHLAKVANYIRPQSPPIENRVAEYERLRTLPVGRRTRIMTALRRLRKAARTTFVSLLEKGA